MQQTKSEDRDWLPLIVTVALMTIFITILHAEEEISKISKEDYDQLGEILTQIFADKMGWGINQ